MQQTIPGFTEPFGKLILESRGLFPEAKWYWIGLFLFLKLSCKIFLQNLKYVVT
jgi:hypothetical protein